MVAKGVPAPMVYDGLYGASWRVQPVRRGALPFCETGRPAAPAGRGLDQMRNVKSVTLAMLLGACLWTAGAPPLIAANGNFAQHTAAEQYLAALAAGDAQAMALSILEDELVQLRNRLLDEMKLEADRNESLTRTRLFGDGMPLADIERLTPHNFFVMLAQRLRFSGREFRNVEWIEAVKDRGGVVQMVGRLVPHEDMGDVRVPVLVSIVPWGKDWKAALPAELQAQIDDLRKGRTRAPRTTATGTAPATGVAPPAATGSGTAPRSEEHTSELQSQSNLVCRLLLEKKK